VGDADHGAECLGAADPRQGDAGHVDEHARGDTWLSVPVDEALKLQRPLPSEILQIGARGEREDAHENAMKPSDTSHAVAAHAADRMTCCR
jgi:hypothetical protein